MPVPIRIAAAVLCAFAAASAVQAQQRIKPAANSVPSAAARIAQTAPKPTGLVPIFPAGVSSGSGAAVATNPIPQSTSPIPTTGSSLANTTLIPAELPPAVTMPATTGVGTLGVGAGATPFTPSTPTVPATNVLGAGAAYGGAGSLARGPGQAVAGAGGLSATDAARLFYFADANHDGELTRAEFGRLGYASMSFEEMDRNYDGVISRFEYEDSLR